MFNTPCNPTGIAYTKDELAALGNVIANYPHIIVASDDIYEHHLWNHAPFCNILNACPALYNQCVIINSVSKTYAMTGWRIGYAAGPQKIIGAMRKAQSQNTSSPCTISQYAAEEALKGDQSCVKEMTKAYKARHEFVYQALLAMPGIQCLPSDGTFYSFPCVRDLLNQDTGITDDTAFAEYLLSEADVAVIPGTAFGGPGHIRICYTASMDKLIIAMARIKEAIEKLQNK
jgi:aspartate aminotransferase